MALADSNIWLALALSKHEFHSAARTWLAQRGRHEALFCRSTQQSFLRLADWLRREWLDLAGAGDPKTDQFEQMVLEFYSLPDSAWNNRCQARNADSYAPPWRIGYAAKVIRKPPCFSKPACSRMIQTCSTFFMISTKARGREFLSIHVLGSGPVNAFLLFEIGMALLIIHSEVMENSRKTDSFRGFFSRNAF